MYVTSDDASIASTPQPVIPEDNFNVPQSTSDAYQTSTTPDANFNPVNDVMPSVPGGLLRFHATADGFYWTSMGEQFRTDGTIQYK
jgi:hypothetical protein